MRIVHAPTEIAGQMGMLCHGIRRKGIEVTGYNWFHSYIEYKDHIINTDSYELVKLVDVLIKHCDIFHFHNGNSMTVDHRDLASIREMGKKIVMHHWGNDVRAMKYVQQLNPYILPPSYLSDESIHKQLVSLTRYIKTTIVQDYEVFPYVKDYYEKVCILPLACNMQRFLPCFPSPDQKSPIIVHAPTNRDFKGSEYIDKAIDQLKMKNTFTYLPIEKLSHQKALEVYRSSDIIIDQILCGSYGMLSVEAMSMGKVVVAFIRDDVRKHLPDDLPIVIANPDTLYDVLNDLIQQPEKRHMIGKASRKYAEKHHGILPVVNKLLRIYHEL